MYVNQVSFYTISEQGIGRWLWRPNSPRPSDGREIFPWGGEWISLDQKNWRYGRGGKRWPLLGMSWKSYEHL